MPENFLEQLFFLTVQEAQRVVDRYYPGWRVKMFSDGIARIYDPKGQLQWTIINEKQSKTQILNHFGDHNVRFN